MHSTFVCLSGCPPTLLASLILPQPQLAFICKPQRRQCDQACNLQFQAVTPQGMQREMAGSKIKFNLNASSAERHTPHTHTHTHDCVHVRCVWVCVQFVGCLPCWFPIGNCWKIKVICIYLQNRAARATAATMPACLAVLHHSASSTPSLLLDTPRHDVVGVSSCVCVGMWKITRFIAYDCRYNLLICRTIFATSLPRLQFLVSTVCTCKKF